MFYSVMFVDEISKKKKPDRYRVELRNKTDMDRVTRIRCGFSIFDYRSFYGLHKQMRLLLSLFAVLHFCIFFLNRKKKHFKNTKK